ncbi:MAG TPA: hypothetical protein VGG74_08230 [Kofleriaceae bacterium]|jgi:hypothetical protein
MRALSIAVVMVIGCKSSEPPPAHAGSAAPVAAPVAATPADAKPARPAPTKAQLAAYHQHVKRGWALQKQLEWAAAVPEFEAALAAIPADQRALSELGFSAMNAGDFAKARRADEEAVRVAIDKNLRAASLYNLGLVQEKSADVDGARASFAASLALRPNKTVEQEVAKLGGSAAPPAFCAQGAAPCDCVKRAAFADADAQCEAVKDGPAALPAFHVYRASSPPFSWDYLLDEHSQLVAIIGGGMDTMRVTETVSIAKLDIRTIAGHRVLWLQTDDSSDEEDPNGEDQLDSDMRATTTVTLCVLDPAGTRCPLSAPVAQSRQADAGMVGEKAIDTATTLDLAIADDGTATLKLVKGPSDPQLDALVGPHKLW